MRTQFQFESESDRRQTRIIDNFSRFILGLFLWITIFLGSLAVIGYCSAHGEEIDNKVEMHINHLMR